MSSLMTTQEGPSQRKQKAGLFVAPALAGLIYLIPFPNLPDHAHLLAAILTWVVVSWITEALPLAMTSLLGAAFCVAGGAGVGQNRVRSFCPSDYFSLYREFLFGRGLCCPQGRSTFCHVAVGFEVGQCQTRRTFSRHGTRHGPVIDVDQ